MRFISTRIHGVLDYIVGIVLILAPWILGFARGGAETWVPVIIGALIIVYSLMTDYELGAVKAIKMPTHLVFDGIAGLFLAISPWLFGFAYFVWVPHLLIGILGICAAIFTQKVPSYGRMPRAM